MSGLLRNLIAFIFGIFSYGSKKIDESTWISFLVTPLDTGIRILKSDKYLQFVETAQLDYLLKTGGFISVIGSGASFVNIAQLVKFARPVPLFSRAKVETKLVYSNEKFAYFFHSVFARGGLAAEVTVK